MLLKKVIRIKNSIGQNASEQKSSLSGLFRPSHLPYKAKSEKCWIFVFNFISPYFPYYPLKGLPIEPSMACHLTKAVEACGEQVAESSCCLTVEEAVAAAAQIGYPVLVPYTKGF